MDKEISSALGRLDRYLFRVKRAIRNGELALALSDTAELAELARRLWIKLEGALNQREPEQTTTEKEAKGS
jgi:hypothetical protein